MTMDDISSTIDFAMKYPYDGRDTSCVSGPVRAALSVLHDLNDRRGIKNGFFDVDEEIKTEIVDTLAAIIGRAMTMDAAQVRAILGDAVRKNGRISGFTDDDGAKITFQLGDNVAMINGLVTADELEAIAAHMRAHGGK